MLKPEVKEKWVKALRSGEYMQARGTIFDGVGYCCLGVLAKACGAVTDSDYEYENIVDEGYSFVYRNLNEKEKKQCVKMNDDLKFSFNEIADYIEKEL